MKIAYKNKKLVDGDSKKTFVLAEIEKSLPNAKKVEIGLRCECGTKMLEIYCNHRDNLHVTNVVEMLKEMEATFSEFGDKVHKHLFNLISK